MTSTDGAPQHAEILVADWARMGKLPGDYTDYRVLDGSVPPRSYTWYSRLIEHHTFTTNINQGIGCTQVNSNIIRKIVI